MGSEVESIQFQVLADPQGVGGWRETTVKKLMGSVSARPQTTSFFLAGDMTGEEMRARN